MEVTVGRYSQVKDCVLTIVTVVQLQPRGHITPYHSSIKLKHVEKGYF